MKLKLITNSYIHKCQTEADKSKLGIILILDLCMCISTMEHSHLVTVIKSNILICFCICLWKAIAILIAYLITDCFATHVCFSVLTFCLLKHFLHWFFLRMHMHPVSAGDCDRMLCHDEMNVADTTHLHDSLTRYNRFVLVSCSLSCGYHFPKQLQSWPSRPSLSQISTPEIQPSVVASYYNDNFIFNPCNLRAVLLLWEYRSHLCTVLQKYQSHLTEHHQGGSSLYFTLSDALAEDTTISSS